MHANKAINFRRVDLHGISHFSTVEKKNACKNRLLITENSTGWGTLFRQIKIVNKNILIELL